jgi:hypothetical protein
MKITQKQYETAEVLYDSIKEINNILQKMSDHLLEMLKIDYDSHVFDGCYNTRTNRSFQEALGLDGIEVKEK